MAGGYRCDPLWCRTRLTQLTDEDLAFLNAFAKRRLRRSGLSTEYGEDLVSKALQSVINALIPGQPGRRPRAVHLGSKKEFLDFMKGAVCSTVEAFSRRRANRCKHLHVWTWSASLHENGIEIPAKMSPDQDVVLLDLKRALFKKLREAAPCHLHQTISLWEEVFLWSERIPCDGNHKRRRKVQILARRVLQEIAPEISR